MDASSFLSLRIITGGKGGVGGEHWRKESVQEACDFPLRGLVKWGSSLRKSTMLGSNI